MASGFRPWGPCRSMPSIFVHGVPKGYNLEERTLLLRMFPLECLAFVFSFLKSPEEKDRDEASRFRADGCLEFYRPLLGSYFPIRFRGTGGDVCGFEPRATSSSLHQIPFQKLLSNPPVRKPHGLKGSSRSILSLRSPIARLSHLYDVSIADLSSDDHAGSSLDPRMGRSVRCARSKMAFPVGFPTFGNHYSQSRTSCGRLPVRRDRS